MADEERSIPLIGVDEHDRFIVNHDAVEMLASIRGDIAIVSVVGLYRTGKSYLLNRLIGRQHGFEIGSTVNACTVGIWIWGRPIYLEDKKLTVVFLDTEGMGSTKSMGVIDESAIDGLSLVINLTKHIHVSSRSADSESVDQLTAYFPSFLWVLRDFTLRLIDEEGRRINSRQYLENALKPQSGFSEGVQKKNQIRGMLKSFFQERDCVTLVRPVADEDMLRSLRDVPEEELRPEFVKGLEILSQRVFSNVKPKTLYGRNLDGAMLASLMLEYVDTINSGGVPTISNAWDRVIEQQTHAAMEEALDEYRRLIQLAVVSRSSIETRETEIPCIQLPTSEEEILKVHRLCKAKAKQLFHSRIVDMSKAFAFSESFKQTVKDELNSLLQRNRKASISHCQSIAESLYQPLKDNLKQAPNDFEELCLAVQNFNSELDNLRVDYLSQTSGPALWDSYAALMHTQVRQDWQDWLNRVVQRHRSDIRSMQDEIDRLSKDLASVRGREEAIQKLLKDTQDKHTMQMEHSTREFELERLRLTERLQLKDEQLRQNQSVIERQTEMLSTLRDVAYQGMEEMKAMTDSGSILKEGFLEKLGGGTRVLGRKSWKLRYFVLKGHQLMYYKTKEDYALDRRSIKHEPIDIRGREIKEGENPQVTLEFLIMPTGSKTRTWQLRANSRQDMIEWIQVLQSTSQSHRRGISGSMRSMDSPISSGSKSVQNSDKNLFGNDLSADV